MGFPAVWSASRGRVLAMHSDEGTREDAFIALAGRSMR